MTNLLLVIAVLVPNLLEPLKTLYHPVTCTTSLPQFATRQRCMEIRNIFLDEEGQPKEELLGRELELNFFSNATYIGLVESVGWDGGAYQWVGTLTEYEYSAFYVVYTNGIFHIHAASPAGVWEVRHECGIVYKVVELEYPE